VTALTFGRDGKTLWSGGQCDAFLWDLRQSKTLRKVASDGVKALSMASSADLRVMAAIDGWAWSGLRVWDLSTGKELWAKPDQKDRPVGLAFSPDGKSLLTRHETDVVRVWERSTGKLVRELLPEKKSGGWAVKPLVLSPDGAVVATGRLQSAPEFWRASDGKKLGKLGDHAYWATKGAFTPDGKVRQRAKKLLAALGWPLSGEELRAIRAVEALELIGDSGSKKLLRALASGAPEALLTREAKASLARLEGLAARPLPR
jgi:WD40 repeat protein